MTGETADRHPGEHAGRGSPPGWYADPVRKSTLRRWDGAHWTADVERESSDTHADGSDPRRTSTTLPGADGCIWVLGFAAATLVVIVFMLALIGSAIDAGP